MQRRVPALEQRIAEIISAYDAQGNHRTGTAVDEASAEWLSSKCITSELRRRSSHSH